MGEIQSLTNFKQWRFVLTKENPADFITKGMRVSDKTAAEGSSQAGRSNGDWTMISVHEDDQLWRLDPKRFSSWTKLIRVQALVRCFVDNCRRPNRE